jgi:hypothetical protein
MRWKGEDGAVGGCGKLTSVLRLPLEVGYRSEVTALAPGFSSERKAVSWAWATARARARVRVLELELELELALASGRSKVLVVVQRCGLLLLDAARMEFSVLGGNLAHYRDQDMTRTGEGHRDP